MKPERIVVGQKLAQGKLHAAREMRREMTPAERRLWAALRHHRLDELHFRRQQIVDGFIADFYCHAAALVVEVVGGVHLEADQAEWDAHRDAAFRMRGLTVVRVTNAEVFEDLAGVLLRIREACRATGDGSQKEGNIEKPGPHPPAPSPTGRGGAPGF